MLSNLFHHKISVPRIKAKEIAVFCSLLVVSSEVSAWNPTEYLSHGHALMQFGAYWGSGAKNSI